MPFTPAHAAAALPLLRTRLVPSALIVGTMAPDFEYFLRLAPGGGFGHTFAGAFLLSLPLALVVLWMFQALVKAPLVQLFPDPLRLRIPVEPFRFGGPGRFMLIVASALTGIFTHIGWDSFTHSYTWPAKHFPWLDQRQVLPFFGSVEHCAMLQQAGTIAGLALLVWWVVRWFRNTPPVRTDRPARMPVGRRRFVLACIAGIVCAGTFLRVALIMPIPGLRHRWETVIGVSSATVIALAWWALVAYSLLSARPRSHAKA